MSDYKELVEELRDADQTNWKRLSLDAADAIEKLCDRPSWKYDELVKALRCCATMTCKGDECKYMIPEPPQEVQDGTE